MAAAQVQLRSRAVQEEVREVLQGLQVEEAQVEATVKHAARFLSAEQEVMSGRVKCSSQQSCHVEVALAQLLPGVVHQFKGDASGAFTCSEAAFECATLTRGDAALIVNHTSSFFISIRPNNRVTLLFCDETLLPPFPRVLGVLQARLAHGTSPMPGLGKGPAKWCF